MKELKSLFLFVCSDDDELDEVMQWFSMNEFTKRSIENGNNELYV